MSKLRAKPPEEIKRGKIKMLVFGKAGAGKSRFAIGMPSPYVIAPEDGTKEPEYVALIKEKGGVHMGNEEGAGELDVIIEQVKALATEEHPYKSLVIDSITKVFQMEIAKEAERLGDKDAFGASKKPAVNKMRRLVAWLMQLDMNVIFVAHETTEWGLQNGQRQEIGKMPDVWDKLPYEVDLVLHIEHPNVNIRTARVTKSRLSAFPEFSRFDLQDKSGDVGYQNFAERYGRDFIEAEVKPIALSSPEQVAEIERLAEVVTGGKEALEKALAKADVDEVAEFTSEQATKVIEWFAKKLNPEKKESKK